MYDEIIRTANARKVCDGCEAIILYHNGRCPECGAYRFRSAVEEVITLALELKNRQE